MKKYRLGLLLLFICIRAQAQEKPMEWSLRGCIDYASEQNIQIKKSKIALEGSKVDTKLAKAQLFPSLSFSTSHGLVNYPSPGDTRTENNQYSGSYELSSSWLIYNGGKRSNTIRQQQLQEQVQQFTIEEAADNIELSITQVFLEILYAEESVKINEQTVEVSRAQWERSRELYKAGSISQTDYAQLESQYSQDKYQLVVSQSNLENMKLELKQLLELDISEDITLVIPDLQSADVLQPLPPKDEIYRIALGFMPRVKSDRLSIDVARLEQSKAKAGYLPSLSLNAGIGTGSLSGSNYNFGQQLRNKFSENIGLTLSVPIYSNRENKSAVEKAKLKIADAELDLMNSRKEILKSVESVYQDATSSQNRYVAAVEQEKAAALSYQLTEEQFFLGIKNTLELLTEKNNLLSARQELVQAKYMSILNMQLLNFYQNKPIDLN